MGRSKLRKFADTKVFNHVLEPGKPLYQEIKGQWNETFFKNDHDIILELACGRGEYTVGLAQAYPEKNFIGIDRKGDRLWHGSQFAIDHQLSNVGFLRTLVNHLDLFFAPGEVSEIWIVFPDPRPKNRDEKRRLTHPRFLDLYQQLIRQDGWVRLKTDNPGLFEYTLEVLQNRGVRDLTYTRDLYNDPLYAEHHGIVTKYEALFTAKGFTVNYLKFRF
jgi:tRNA (guanine-N7-)-methyltransferase